MQPNVYKIYATLLQQFHRPVAITLDKHSLSVYSVYNTVYNVECRGSVWLELTIRVR